MTNILRIVSRQPGLWRAGIQHPAGPIDHDPEDFTPDQVTLLTDEPLLDVTMIEIEDPETDAEAKAEAAAKEKAEAEAKEKAETEAKEKAEAEAKKKEGAEAKKKAAADTKKASSTTTK